MLKTWSQAVKVRWREYCAAEPTALQTMYPRHKGPLYLYLLRGVRSDHNNQKDPEAWLKEITALLSALQDNDVQ